MKNNLTIRTVFVILGMMMLLAPALQAQVPTMMNYQGRVTAGGADVNGTGYFKFALVNAAGNTTYWSNDGSSTGGNEPASAVALSVADGLFSVMLGDTSIPNMLAFLSPFTFEGVSDAHLRIWFSLNGMAFDRLTPDQPLGSTAYAMMAARVASGAVGASQLAVNSVTADKIAAGTITSNKIDWNTMPAMKPKGYAENGTFANAPVASGDHAIAMGRGAQASGDHAAVAGGEMNVANGDWAFIGGGSGNAALGRYATIPGGYTNSATTYSFAAGYRAKAIHTGCFVWSDMRYADFSSTRSNQFAVRAGGGMWIQAQASGLSPAACRIESTTANGVGLHVTQTSSDANLVLSNPGSGDHIKAYSGAGAGTLVFRVANNGAVTALSFNPTSDRNAKDDFQAVEPREILEKVLALPITTWSFKAQDSSIRHIGPMAQDFHAAFGVGESDTVIATIDADGVALAAIQGLAAEVGGLKEENADLRARLERLEALIAGID